MNKRLLLEGAFGVKYLPVSDIIFCQANDNWTCIYTIGQAKYEVCHTLKRIEERINSNDFFRSHRSYLVNLLYVKEIPRSYEFLLMHEEFIVRVSRRKRSHLKKKMKSYITLV